MSESSPVPEGVQHGPFPDDGTSYSQSKGLRKSIREAYDRGDITSFVHVALQDNLKTLGHVEILEDIESTFEGNV